MNEVVQILLFFLLIVSIAPFLGRYMAKVFQDEWHIMKPVLSWMEKSIYRITGISGSEEMNWKSYLYCLLLFNFFGIVMLFLLQMIQPWLPLNAESLPAPSWHLALNTAVSFATNTNWQSYCGEKTMGYMVQMLGLTVQNFVSAATGIAVAVALLRGLTRKTTDLIGSFWVDLTRTVVYILLPFSVVLAIMLAGQGVVQTFSPYVTAITLQGNEQVIPLGPVASQISIKLLGTNGGGFFGANSAHPFENPTPFTNFLEMFALLIIPASLVFTYGRFARSGRQAWTVFLAMFIMLALGLGISIWSEFSYNNVLHVAGNMEGKETRFGITNSVLFSVLTTATSCGAVNSMHDSMSPLSGMISMFNIMLGEVIFGGVGSGLYGMVIFILLTVFIAGLMVGRTPEFLGKRVEAFEIKMAIVAILAPGIVILLFSAVASLIPAGLGAAANSGPHGLSEILYAFSSAAGNNGSAFGGLGADTMFYNNMLALGMLIGRFGVIIPVLAIAGSMAKKRITPVSSGTFSTDNGLFVVLLISIIIIIGGLTFLPTLVLGPVAEHLLMNLGTGF